MNSLPTQVDLAEATPDSRAECEVLPVPESLVALQARPGESPSAWIEYGRHPAYATLLRATATDRMIAFARFSCYFGLILCKRIVSYELIPAHLRKPRTPRTIVAFAAAAVRNAGQKILPSSQRYRPTTGVRILQALRAHGICAIRMENRSFARVQRAAAPLVEELRRKRGRSNRSGREFAESRGAALRTADAELYSAVEEMLERGGTLDACSGYIGHRAALIDVNPQVNDSSDDFWQRIFPDLPAQEHPAAYFHRDASGGDLKAILYLSDVGPRNGPFSYVVGSHRARGSVLTDWIEETNDQSGFSSTGPNQRRMFAALPSRLRRKCAFGNDVLPDTASASKLLASQWTIEASQGHLVLFDTKGIHRGGMVQDGERIVLTCVIGSARRRDSLDH